MKGERLGEFEELALLAAGALGDEAYGIAIQELLEGQTRREVSLGAVYAALERMERKGLVVSALGEVTPERGGRRKRLFTVTDDGLRALREARDTRDALWTAARRAGLKGRA
jgi:DNA-binding PadR family transcriptional regulator